MITSKRISNINVADGVIGLGYLTIRLLKSSCAVTASEKKGKKGKKYKQTMM
jgi:hypothetical protein